MTILVGEQISETVRLLQARGARLYHACQLLDFQSYVGLGGIPSRQLLEESGLPFTPFISDHDDQRNGVWDLVFGNLEEFGAGFALGRWGEAGGPPFIPNVYGPITLEISPQSLLEAEDLAVSLVSAGRPGFDRDRDSLDSPEAIDACFYDGRKLKFTTTLAEEHGLPGASHPEWSISSDGLLSMEHVLLARVEPIVVRERRLLSRVLQIGSDAGLRVYERDFFREGRLDLLQALVCGIESRASGSAPACDGWEARAERYVQSLERHPGAKYQFERFVEYWEKGTIRPLLDLSAV